MSDSTTQKVNARSLTEAKLIAVDDKIAKIIWIRRFIESQGFKIYTNVVHQDNKSTIRLENNGEYSSGKRTRHFDIKYFYITDLIERKEVEVQFCPSDVSRLHDQTVSWRTIHENEKTYNEQGKLNLLTITRVICC